ncbi:MAG: 2Fe-2S iron-sulfur cluster-binding protein, partial [Sulfolobales archaeon]
MVKLYVNDKEVQVEAASTLLDAIVRAGFKVPTLCYLKDMFNEATCRVCIVELSGGRLVPSCSYPVAEGIKVFTDSERVLRYRRAIIEMILAAHKIKC